MSTKPSLSLIVPYYKNIHSIDKLLTSLNAALNHLDSYIIELIFLNNNSIDGTECRVKGFSNAKCSIVHTSELNQGVSFARNTGIAASRGNYVAFLDADDTIEPCYFSDIVQALKFNPDVVFIKHDDFVGIQSYVQCNVNALLNTHLNGWWNWQFIFKRSALVDLSFQGACFEDFGFFPLLLAQSGNCVVLKRGLYRYNDNPASITKRSADWRIPELQGQFDRLCSLSNELSVDIFNKVRFDFYEHISLLRAIAGHFPVLGLNESIKFLKLSQSFRGRFDCAKRLLKLNGSTLFRSIKGLLIRASR